MDNSDLINKISLNFYVMQGAKTLLILFMILKADNYLLAIPLGMGFVCLALQSVTLTIAHHNYTSSLSDQSTWYLHTVVIDFITTFLILANSIFLCVGVITL